MNDESDARSEVRKYATFYDVKYAKLNFCSSWPCVIVGPMLKVALCSSWPWAQVDPVLKLTLCSSWTCTQVGLVLKWVLCSSRPCAQVGFVLKMALRSSWLCAQVGIVLKLALSLSGHGCKASLILRHGTTQAYSFGLKPPLYQWEGCGTQTCGNQPPSQGGTLVPQVTWIVVCRTEALFEVWWLNHRQTDPL